MGHTIIYSADELRELIRTASTSLRTSNVDPSRAAFVSALNDHENLEMLLEKPVVTVILPIRDENQSADAADRAQKLERVVVSHDKSLILASHDYKTETKRYMLNHSRERWAVIQEFGELARAAPCFSDFPEICMTAASELITNAFYNAPRDANGEPIETDRRIPVTLERPIEVRFGEDETYIWLEVRDFFGTFSREALIRSLLKSAAGEGLAVNMENGGAGIGLYLVFRWAAQLMFKFDPQRETTVLVKLLKTKRHKTFDGQRAILEILK